ncbi:MAG: purine-binding chemotaxis protein CheW [Planctomycetes bacterium]|nr:purine-binding chemotaxis protein CheW [Planctomycetota bacterium]
MASEQSVAVADVAANKAGKYLTFFLGDQEYGVEILKVREIIGMVRITPVPRTPQFVEGVINLRGKVIPVIDLRHKFDMASVERNEETCIIVVDVNGIEMGIIVDKVSEVQDISGDDIEETPDFGQTVDTEFILGIAKTGGQVTVLLDICEVLTTEQMAAVTKLGGVEVEEEQDE